MVDDLGNFNVTPTSTIAELEPAFVEAAEAANTGAQN